MVGLGIKKPKDGDAMGVVMIAEYYSILQLTDLLLQDVILKAVEEFGQDIKYADSTVSALSIEVLWNSHTNLSHNDMIFEWYLEYSKKLSWKCRTHSNSYKYIFSPDIIEFTSGGVD